jgi:hypothetical protein
MKKLINQWLGVTELYENQTYLMQDYAVIQETLSNCLDVLANLNYNLDKPKKPVSKKVNKVVKKKPVKKVAKK